MATLFSQAVLASASKASAAIVSSTHQSNGKDIVRTKDVVRETGKKSQGQTEEQRGANQDTTAPEVPSPGDASHQHVYSFDALGLGRWLVQQCGAVGIHAPTPVQAACIPPILQGIPYTYTCFILSVSLVHMSNTQVSLFLFICISCMVCTLLHDVKFIILFFSIFLDAFKDKMSGLVQKQVAERQLLLPSQFSTNFQRIHTASSVSSLHPHGSTYK